MRLSGPARVLPGLRTPWPSSCAVLCALFAAGCERYGAEYPTETEVRYLVVHGMLGLGAQDQEIVVEYSRGIGDGYYRGLTPAAGAEVVVVGDGTYRYQEDPAHPGVYRATFSPRPGVRYALGVRGPAGEMVTAETVVPDASRLIAPGADTTIAWGNYVTLRWSSAPGAAGYVVIDRPPGAPGPIGALVHPYILRDTSVTTQPGLFGGTSFYFRIAAVDASYVRYIEGAPGDSSAGRIRSTVSGGYGLFGSYALSNARAVTVR